MTTLLNKGLFKKTLLTTSLLVTLSSANVLAHDSCDIELDAGVKVNTESITFFNENNNNTLYQIDNDRTLIVDDEIISLSNEQQALVIEYSKSIKAMVPKARNIAIEGVQLAQEGVNIAFNELLGEGNSVGADLSHELTNIQHEVADTFTLEHGVTLGENGIQNNEYFGEGFEDRMEEAVEKAVMSSIGSIMIAVGQEMMFSGGDPEAFETKMESFGENIEKKIEAGTKQIEQKADQLCIAAVQIDHLEDKLKSTIPSLSNVDVISARFEPNKDKHDEKYAM
jgi:hypothetical protein